MPVFDHLGITVASLDRGIAQFDPIMAALGFAGGSNDNCAWWSREGETELIMYPAREVSEPHVHGRVGWQHLGFAADSRADVERMHELALNAGWSEVRAPPHVVGALQHERDELAFPPGQLPLHALRLRLWRQPVEPLPLHCLVEVDPETLSNEQYVPEHICKLIGKARLHLFGAQALVAGPTRESQVRLCQLTDLFGKLQEQPVIGALDVGFRSVAL